jgi:hypothetical protein
MKFDIKHRFNSDQIIYSGEGETLAAVIEKAARDGASLVGASLVGANLVGANLVRANLVGANLVRANLDGANLVRASLVGANLDGASLVGANLVRANLVGASLVGANLDGASLDDIKADFYDVLSSAVNEVPGLLSALREGKIDGTTYEGDCACLVGTVAKIRKCNYRQLDGLKPDSYRPAERWFTGIRPGHTPANSSVAKITEQWIEEWLLSNPTTSATAGGAS